MKISGIIAEYNPFHNGHIYHMEKTRENGADAIVTVMSGNFVQRGEPALIQKWSRARAALIGGSDLVLELPLPYAVASAETFARGGVDILNRLGCVDEISFGSEVGDIKKLSAVARALQSEETEKALKENLDTGVSYPTALDRAIAEVLGEEYAAIIREPNNVLAIEYLKALAYTESNISPFTVSRMGAGHDSSLFLENTASSSYIREKVKENNFSEISAVMPPISESILKGEIERGDALIDKTKFETAVLSKLRFMNTDYFLRMPDVSEGLENRIMSSIYISRDLNQLYDYIKTKRYTMARVRRIVLSAFLGITKKDTPASVPYVRVLGFTERGREILRTARNTATIPIVMKASDIDDIDNPMARKLFELESRSTDQYVMMTNNIQPCGTDKTANIIRL